MYFISQSIRDPTPLCSEHDHIHRLYLVLNVQENLGKTRKATCSNGEQRGNSREKTDGNYWERACILHNGTIHIYKSRAYVFFWIWA